MKSSAREGVVRVQVPPDAFKMKHIKDTTKDVIPIRVELETYESVIERLTELYIDKIKFVKDSNRKILKIIIDPMGW